MPKLLHMPHSAHLIVADDCRFHLATVVGGKYVVSTVGEYLPGEGSREIMAKSRGVILAGMGDAREQDFLQKVGYIEIGAGRKYETMVFRAVKQKAKCCPYTIKPSELDFEGYNDPGEAREGHERMVARWARKARS